MNNTNIESFLEEKSKTFSLQINKYPFPENNKTNYHFHETYEIWFLIKHKAQAFINTQVYDLIEGDMLIINKNMIHKLKVTINDKIATRMVLEIKEDYFNENHKNLIQCFNKDCPFLRLNFNDKDFVKNKLMKMLNEKNTDKPFSQKYVDILFTELLIFLNRKIDKQKAYKTNEQDETTKLIMSISEYITKNYQHDLKLELLAQKFSFSKYYICRKFKEITNFTINEYINNVRVKKAQDLLKSTETKVTEISGMVGYNSISQFYRMFNKISNTTPLEYRKKQN
ncbi:MAG: AraC family transcriptional regulator [Bacillota bacterium]